MAWYSTGTVSVTNGSTTVTGSGTNFTSGARAGEAFYGPDGKLYEVGSVVSSTQLTLNTAYLGSTATGQSYSIIPTQGLVANLATQVSNLITDFQDVADLAGEGKFGDGTVSAPGIRFNNDQDTGFFRETGNEIAIATGGIKQAEVNSAGINIPDSKKITFGDSNDLEITHDGSHTYIKETNSTGSLRIWAKDFELYNADGTENIINADADGGIQLYHNNIQKVNVTSTGLDVTGTLTSDGLTVDGSATEVKFTTTAGRMDLFLTDTDTTDGQVRVRGDANSLSLITDTKLRQTISSGGDISFYEDTGVTPKLAWSASNERLTLTGSDYQFGIAQGANQPWYMRGVSDGSYRLHLNGTGDIITATASGVNVTGVLTTDGITTSADINFGDNDKAVFGDSSDLQIYHDGSSTSYITTSTGNLIIQDTDGGTVFIRGKAGENSIIANDDGSVRIFYDNAEKLATTASGVDVTGTVTADGLTVDGNATVQTSNPKFTITNTAQRAYSFNVSGTSFYLKDESDAQNIIRIDEGGDISFYEDTGTTPKLFWDASAERLGIGTTSPDRQLELSLPTTTTTLGEKGGIQFKANSSTVGNGGEITWQAGVGDTERWCAISGHITDNSAAGAKGDLIFAVKPNTSDTTLTEALRIKSSGNVGIGTTGPSAKLEVNGYGKFTSSDSSPRLYLTGGRDYFLTSTSTGIFGLYDNTASSYRLVVDANGNLIVGGTTDGAASSITLQNDGDIRGVLASGAGGDTLISAISGVSNGYQIYVDTSNNQVYRWHNGGTQSMTLDASGNLLVGKTSTSSAIAGTTLWAGGYLNSTVSSDYVGRFNRLSTDGEILQFQKDGSTVGSIGSNSGTNLIIGTGDTGIYFNAASDAVHPWNISSNAARDNAIDLGRSADRFKDLYLSGGVVFGATGGSVTSKTLDDYEEGTWTPDFKGSGNQDVTVSSEEGFYTKIGNTVFCRFVATVTTAYNEGSYLQWETGVLPFTATASGFRDAAIYSNAEGFVRVAYNRVYISPNTTTDTIYGQFNFTV